MCCFQESNLIDYNSRRPKRMHNFPSSSLFSSRSLALHATRTTGRAVPSVSQFGQLRQSIRFGPSRASIRSESEQIESSLAPWISFAHFVRFVLHFVATLAAGQSSLSLLVLININHHPEQKFNWVRMQFGIADLSLGWTISSQDEETHFLLPTPSPIVARALN